MGVVATVDLAHARVKLAIQMTDTSTTQITAGRVDANGYTELIRAGDLIDVTNGQTTMRDYEAPLDLPVYYQIYQVTPDNGEVQTSNTVTVPSNGASWLKDPGYPSMNFKVPVVTSIQTLTRAARAGVFNVLDRPLPIVVTAKRQGPVGTLIAHTITDMQRNNLTDLLARGTTLLLQTPWAFGFGSQYVSIGDVEEARVGVAQETIRQWTLPFIVVDRPDGLAAIADSGATWSDVKSQFNTWADLTASGKSWSDLLEDGPW